MDKLRKDVEERSLFVESVAILLPYFQQNVI